MNLSKSFLLMRGAPAKTGLSLPPYPKVFLSSRSPIEATREMVRIRIGSRLRESGRGPEEAKKKGDGLIHPPFYFSISPGWKTGSFQPRPRIKAAGVKVEASRYRHFPPTHLLEEHSLGRPHLELIFSFPPWQV